MKYTKTNLTFKDFHGALIQLIANKDSVLSWGEHTPNTTYIVFASEGFLIHDSTTQHSQRLGETNYQYFCNHPGELTLWVKLKWYEKASWENPIPVFVSNTEKHPNARNSLLRFLIGTDDNPSGKFRCSKFGYKFGVPPVTHFKYANPIREEDK